MTCFRPMVAYWYKPEFMHDKPFGLEKPIFLMPFAGLEYDYSALLRVPPELRLCLREYLIPCGKCEGCRMDNLRQWQFRAECELKEHEQSAFITLTVSEDQMDKVFPNRCLVHRPFQLFFKRLRKKIGLSVRYLMCGEYGTNSMRPHYHCIVFGWWPSDAVFFKAHDTYCDYLSDTVGRCWTDPDDGSSYGFHTVSPASETAIRYLVGYVLKKCGSSYPVSSPPYLRASCRPSLGLGFFKKYKDDIFSQSGDLQFPNAYVYCGGRKQSLPRYFCKKYAECADNADYVSFMEFRQKCLAERPLVDKCDLDRMADYYKCVTEASHKKRPNEV